LIIYEQYMNNFFFTAPGGDEEVRGQSIIYV
jgi:hypothetical protein